MKKDIQLLIYLCCSCVCVENILLSLPLSLSLSLSLTHTHTQNRLKGCVLIWEYIYIYIYNYRLESVILDSYARVSLAHIYIRMRPCLLNVSISNMYICFNAEKEVYIIECMCLWAHKITAEVVHMRGYGSHPWQEMILILAKRFIYCSEWRQFDNGYRLPWLKSWPWNKMELLFLSFG